MSEDEDKLEDLKSKDKDLEIQGQGLRNPRTMTCNLVVENKDFSPV